MKWVKKSSLYTFTIKEVDGMFDLDVKCMCDTDYFWFKTLSSAKAYVKKEYEGLNLYGRWEKVDE